MSQAHREVSDMALTALQKDHLVTRHAELRAKHAEAFAAMDTTDAAGDRSRTRSCREARPRVRGGVGARAQAARGGLRARTRRQRADPAPKTAASEPVSAKPRKAKPGQRALFERQEIAEPADDQPTQTLRLWDVTLDDKKVGVLKRVRHPRPSATTR
jgi:hypothetical protein